MHSPPWTTGFWTVETQTARAILTTLVTQLSIQLCLYPQNLTCAARAQQEGSELPARTSMTSAKGAQQGSSRTEPVNRPARSVSQASIKRIRGPRSAITVRQRRMPKRRGRRGVCPVRTVAHVMAGSLPPGRDSGGSLSKAMARPSFSSIAARMATARILPSDLRAALRTELACCAAIARPGLRKPSARSVAATRTIATTPYGPCLWRWRWRAASRGTRSRQAHGRRTRFGASPSTRCR